MIARLVLWCVGRQKYWAKPRYTGCEFYFGRAVEYQCSFLPHLFFSPAPGPQAKMDVHLDTPEGQESASNSGKGSSSTGNQQGHYPCMNNWDTMLNSLWGGDLLSFHKYRKKAICGPVPEVHNYNVCIASQAADDSHQASHSDLGWSLVNKDDLPNRLNLTSPGYSRMQWNNDSHLGDKRVLGWKVMAMPSKDNRIPHRT